MAQKVNYIVAKTSPNLYAAAQQANLSKEQVNQIEQYSWTVDKNKSLARLRVEDARKEFASLDTDVQDMLKFLYPNAEYTKQAPDALDNTLKIGKTVLTGLASPLVLTFKALGSWNRLINTPYLMARQAQQGEGLFNKQTFTDAWDGRRVYDNEALGKAVKTHGNAKVEVAKGLIAGKTPGEIIQQYGNVDDELLAAIKEAYNKEDSFKTVLDDVKYSQVSPGRDIARAVFGTKPGNLDWRTRKTSGAIDFMYQLVVDPLTWATGGTSKLAPTALSRLVTKTNGDKMVESIRTYGTAGVEDAFNKFPDIRKHWDTEIGPAVKNYIDADGAYAKGEAFRKITEQFPGHANRSWVSLLARNNVIDAESAIQYFGKDVDAAKKLMSGRVDGMQFYRNGIPTSRNQRQLGSRFSAKVNDFLNPKYTEEEGEAAWKAITAVGPEDANFVSPEVKDLEKFYKNISRKEKVARLMGRTPQGRSIRIGDNAIETADVFYDTVRQILPADLSDMITHKFVNSTADEQVQVLRSVYTAIMQKAGLEGHVAGKKLIDETLAAKFGNVEGMSVVTKLDIPTHLTGKVKGVGVKIEDGLEHYESNGLIHPFQERDAIGNLDYQLIAQTAYEVKTKKNLIMAVTQGAAQHKYASEFVNFWSVFTLFPRLGMRSAVDEGVMFMLTAPAKDIFDALAPRIVGKGRRMGKVATAATGSKSTEGFKATLRNRLGLENISESIDIGKRIEIRRQIAKEHGISEEEVANVELALATAHHAKNLFPLNLNDDELRHFMQVMSHQGHVLAGSASSIAGRASLTSRPATEIMDQLISLSKFDVMLKESDIVSGAKGAVIHTRDIERAKSLGNDPLAKVHFENWGKRFYGNARTINGKESVTYRPVDAFFNNNALKTDKDFDIAVDTLLRQVGVSKNKNLIDSVGKETVDVLDSQFTYVVDDPKALADFLTMSSLRTTQLRQRGFSDIEIARDQINRALLDMYATFHGKANNYNEKLLGLVRSKYKDMGDGGNWNAASQAIDFEDFNKLTKNMQPEGKMFTMLDIDGLNDTESAIAKLGNNFMEIMDNQVTGILRQPAVMVSYLRIRKNLSGLEKQHYDDLISNQIKFFKEEGIPLNKPKYYKKDGTPVTYLEDAKENINEIVTKKFTELAVQDAVDTVLKFADNPNIRSNFALSARNVGRFYRATEDFWRRMYRMKDVKLRAAYRMRLAHVGLDASGDIYEDANGEPYVMMPMDDVIFKTVDNVVRTLGPGAESFKQPLFNDFTFKLSLANPSFSPDAGLPTLSGPIGALSILTMKSILGQTGATGKKIGEELDNYALGSIGDNIDVVRAVVPASLQRVYSMLPVNEKNRQEATAAMQAIAYNAAAGNAPGPDSTPEERYEYLKNIRISAHNVMVMRATLGLVSPFTATTQESKNVPDYLLNVGITGLRPEFYDLVNAVTQRYGGDVQNPYDLAVATFVGNNPNKIIYTVSRDDKQTNVLINKTKTMKNWYINNKPLIDTYGEAAFIFAPHTGDFDASSYSWFEAAGFIENKDIEQYYMDVMLSQDKQAYFNIARDEKEALANTISTTARKAIINNATLQRSQMKMSNPLLEAAITGGGNEVANEEAMFTNIEAILNNTDIPIQSGTRSKLLILSNQIRNFINMANDPELRNAVNFSDMKRKRKTEIQELINNFIEGDAVVKEANRAVFQAILDYYSRDTYTAVRKAY